MCAKSKTQNRFPGLEPIFRPRSVAVVGASKTPGKIGKEILSNLISCDYQGIIYPVNPKASHIHSIKAYPSVSAVPGDVDLAVIVVEKSHVLPVVEECGRKGVKGLVVITAGFREIGGAGVELEEKLLALVRKYRMRMVGPNCMGVLNTEEEVRLNATFAGARPMRGKISFLSQSGALGVAILEHAREHGLALSKFVSLGNKADVTANDVLEYWRDDPNTNMILMYLESFGNPRKFVKVAAEISEHKPILAVKSGRTARGALAASSHTGAIAAADVFTGALFDKSGVLRVDTMEELFDIARLFARQPVLKGKRIGIVSNAGGPGILATDALENYGLEIASFSEKTTRKLRELLPEESSANNPVDMIASADGDRYRRVIDIVKNDPGVDGLLVIFVPPITANPVEIAQGIVEATRDLGDKPVISCFMGQKHENSGVLQLENAGIPNYIFPESAVRSLAALYKYHLWKNREQGRIRRFRVDREAVRAVLDRAREQGRDQLGQDEVYTILKAYGVGIPKLELAREVKQALRIARRIGYPVALKVDSEKIVHKSDAGGVIVGVRNELELRGAWQKIMEASLELTTPEHINGILIQEMIRSGKETIIGMTTDPAIGPLLMFGLGGIYVEVMKDVQFKIAPITDSEARELVRGIKGFKLLEGTRGEAPADIRAAEETLQRISQLITDFHEILEMDLNPFVLLEKGNGGVALDGRVTIALD